MEIKVGIKGSAEAEVTSQNTAVAYGSGGVEVFATPAMIGLMENAALTSIQGILPEGFSSVGTKVDVVHLAATPVGLKVNASSEIVEVDGKRIVFRVEAYDSQGLIGKGIHERFIIDVEKFMSRAQGKLQK